MDISMIQPFEFLGVTVKSTITEIRQAYYRMALIVHPDRGGSTHDMHILQRCYEWIMQQMQLQKDISYEDIEKDFKTFLQTQCYSEDIPSLSEISIESHGMSIASIRSFYDSMGNTDESQFLWFLHEIKRELLIQSYVSINARNFDVPTFLKNVYEHMKSSYKKIYHSSVPGGYTHIMKEDTSFGKKELISYEDKQTYLPDKGAPLQLPEQMDDYSLYINPLFMQDYQQAFMEIPHELYKVEDKETSIEEALECLRTERAIQETSI